MWPLYEFGLFGVQIFWCISGLFSTELRRAIAARRIETRASSGFVLAPLSAEFHDVLIVAGLQPVYAQLRDTTHLRSGAVNSASSRNGRPWTAADYELQRPIGRVARYSLCRLLPAVRHLVDHAADNRRDWRRPLHIWSGATSRRLCVDISSSPAERPNSAQGSGSQESTDARCMHRDDRSGHSVGAVGDLTSSRHHADLAVGCARRSVPRTPGTCRRFDRWQRPTRRRATLPTRHTDSFPLQLTVAIISWRPESLPVGDVGFC